MIVTFTSNDDRNGYHIVAQRGDTRSRLYVSTALSLSPIFATAAKAFHANAMLLTRHLTSRAENLSETGFDKEAPDIVRNSLSPEMRSLRRTALSRRDELDGQWNDWATPRFSVAPVQAGNGTELASSIAGAISAAYRREAIRQRLAALKLTEAFAAVLGDRDATAAVLEAGREASPFPPRSV